MKLNATEIGSHVDLWGVEPGDTFIVELVDHNNRVVALRSALDESGEPVHRAGWMAHDGSAAHYLADEDVAKVDRERGVLTDREGFQYHVLSRHQKAKQAAEEQSEERPRRKYTRRQPAAVAVEDRASEPDKSSEDENSED